MSGLTNALMRLLFTVVVLAGCVGPNPVSDQLREFSRDLILMRGGADTYELLPTMPGQAFTGHAKLRTAASAPDVCFGLRIGLRGSEFMVMDGGAILSSSALPGHAPELDLVEGEFAFLTTGQAIGLSSVPVMLLSSNPGELASAGATLDFRIESDSPFSVRENAVADVLCLTEFEDFEDADYVATAGLAQARHLGQNLATSSERFLWTVVASSVQHVVRLSENSTPTWEKSSPPPSGGVHNATFLLGPGGWAFEVDDFVSGPNPTTGLLSVELPDAARFWAEVDIRHP